MAADDFALVPTNVVEVEPKYHNIITESESEKKEYLNLSVTPLQKYQLSFKGATTITKDAILTHYKGRYGGYDSFAWTSVPAYIESAASITGRWVDGSLSFSPNGNNHWDVSIVIEKAT